jgi:hypothetical protein
MKLTRERKVYAAVLGLGLGVLLMDKVFFGGGHLSPGTAAAAAGPTAAEGNPAPSASVPASVKAAPGGAQPTTLAVRLESVRPVVPLGGYPGTPFAADSLVRTTVAEPLHGVRGRGLFSTWAEWLAPAAAKVESAPQERAETLRDVLARHKINTLVDGKGGARSFLIVDGARREEGSSFDGVTVVKIGNGVATLARGAERADLRFDAGVGDR